MLAMFRYSKTSKFASPQDISIFSGTALQVFLFTLITFPFTFLTACLVLFLSKYFTNMKIFLNYSLFLSTEVLNIVCSTDCLH